MAWRRYDRTSFFTINSTNKDVEQSTCCQRRSHRSSRKTLGREVLSFLAKLALVSEGLIGCQAVFQLKNIISASPTNKFISTNRVGQIFPFDTGNPDSLKVMRIFLGKTLLKILKKINKSPFSLCRIFYYQFAPLSLETYFVYSHTWKACAFDRIKSL